MKKSYVVPESKLFAINLKESIAASDKITNGDDEISANAVIKFTVSVDPCREVYTALIPVSESAKATNTFQGYYNDLNEQVGSGVANGYLAYFNCFKFGTDV